MGPALHLLQCTTRAREAEPSAAAGRFSFCSGWRRSGSVRRRRRAQRATGSTSPPAACTGKADGSRPCARSEISAVHFIRWRGGAERRAGLTFWPLAGHGRGRATGQDRRRRLAPGGSRAPKIASALHLHPKGSRVDTASCTTRAREAEPSPPPADFLFANSLGGAARSVRRRRRAQRATGSTSPPAACTGKLMARVHLLRALHARARLSRARRRPIFFLRIRLVAPRRWRRAQRARGRRRRAPAARTRRADGSGPGARARISAVHFIRWRYGAARRAGFSFSALAVAVELGGQDRRRRLAPGGSRSPKIASALNCIRKGPAFTCFVHYTRARGGAEPAAGRISFCESGWWRSRSVRRRRRAQRATGSTSPPAACTGKLMARVDHYFVHYARARGGAEPATAVFLLPNPVGGAEGVFGGGAEHSELRGRRRRRRLAPAG